MMSHRREEDLLSIIPRDRRRSYDVRRILRAVLDRNSIFEIGPHYGRPLVCAPGAGGWLSGRRDGQRSAARRWAPSMPLPPRR